MHLCFSFFNILHISIFSLSHFYHSLFFVVLLLCALQMKSNAYGYLMFGADTEITSFEINSFSVVKYGWFDRFNGIFSLLLFFAPLLKYNTHKKNSTNFTFFPKLIG